MLAYCDVGIQHSLVTSLLVAACIHYSRTYIENDVGITTEELSVFFLRPMLHFELLQNKKNEIYFSNRNLWKL